MPKFSHLLTGIINGKQQLNRASIKKQQLAAATAWQILQYLPNRRKPKEWLKYSHLRGVLLADEVGGGKTFEALTVISKGLLDVAKNRRTRFRVLVIAAPAIRSKWEWKETDESDKWCDMKRYLEQTNISATEKGVLETFFRTAQGNNIVTNKHSWKSIQKARQGIWISSFGALPATKGNKKKAVFKSDRHIQFPVDFYDYIIADEAHIVKSGYLDGEENFSPALNNSAIRKIYAVQNDSRNSKLLLLTATPFQNNLNELIHMLSLIEAPNNLTWSIARIIELGLSSLYKEIELLKSETSIGSERILHLLKCFNDSIGSLIDETCDEIKRPTEIATHGRRNGLDDFIRDIMVRNTKTALNVISDECFLDEAEKLQYLLMRELVSGRQEDEKEMFSTKLSQLVSSGGAFSNTFRNARQSGKYKSIISFFKNRNLIFEKKFNALLKIINRKTPPMDKKVVVVFCRFIPTIKTLEERLKKLYSHENILRMDGSVVSARRRKELLYKVEQVNHNSKGVVIFLVSQVGNEGLDFDRFSDTVVHFDGHYNPAVIDQRNGRVYRRDNLDRELTIRHIYLKETYDQRIKFIEMEKRKLKNFFLGDSSLQEIIEKIILTDDFQEEKYLFNELEKVKFNFEPKEKYLLSQVKKYL